MCSNYLHQLFILVLLVWPARLDHTTFCINFPNVEYRDESLKSLGFEYFPTRPDFVNWTFFQEELEGYYLKTTEEQQKPPLPWSETVGQYPMGTINLYAIKYKQRYLNGWYRVEFKFSPSILHQDMHSCMKMFTLKAFDDLFRRQDIGEFVLDFPGLPSNNCPQNDATKYTILSCGGASKAEPLVSNNIVLLRDNPKDGNGHSIYPEEAKGLQIIPELREKKSLNYYIRIPLQACNQKQVIAFRARIVYDKDCLIGVNQDSDITKPNKSDTYRLATASVKTQLNRVPGACDPLPVPSQAHNLDCESGKLSSTSEVPSFMQQGSFVNQGDGGQLGPQEHWLEGCQGEYFAGRCKYDYFDIIQENTKLGQPQPKGPKEIVNQNEAFGGNIPICTHYRLERHELGQPGGPYYEPKWYNEKEPIPFPHTQEYLRTKNNRPCKDLYNDNPGCNVTKILPEGSRRRGYRRPHLKKTFIHVKRRGRGDEHDNDNDEGHYRQDVPEEEEHKHDHDPDEPGPDHHILSLWEDLKEEEKARLGVPFDKHGFTQLVYGMRQAHAVIMAVIVFFVMPVHLFITRYYKESFMNKRILYTRVWYQVHVHGILITGALLIASILPIMTSKRYLGKSIVTAAICHRVLGWMGITLFGIMTVLGGFRAFEDPLRKVTIFLHWLFGMIFYLLMYGLMLNGLFIPGNGVGHVDPSNVREIDGGETIYGNLAFIHVVSWFLFEILMHLIMSLKIVGFDVYMGVTQRRIYLPVLIPVLKEHSTISASGHTMRVIILVAYVCGAFLSTATYFVLNIGLNSRGWVNKGLGPMSCTHDPNTLLILTNITDDCTN